MQRTFRKPFCASYVSIFKLYRQLLMHIHKKFTSQGSFSAWCPKGFLLEIPETFQSDYVNSRRTANPLDSFVCLSTMSWLSSFYLLKWIRKLGVLIDRETTRWILKSALNVWFYFNFEEIFSLQGVVDGFSPSNLFFFDFLKLFSVWHPRKGCATQKRKLFGSFYFF